MDVAVEGWRSTPANWREAHRIPAEEVPPLTEAQKEVARKMRVAEEDYARSAFAGRLTQADLLEKATRFAALLNRRLKAIREDAEVDSITLQTTEHQFALVLRVTTPNGDFKIPLRIAEELADDLLETRSEKGIERLDGMLLRAFALENV